jgi:uncharacterized protein (DUF58 family)
MIFDEPTRRKLARLSLVAGRARHGAYKGERRSSQKGSSVEFADYRDYVPGDDLRRLDWNIYARLDRPFIKLLEDEEDLAVHLLVDASRSMDWGEGESNKYRYALRLAAALGLIGLASGDQLTLILLQGENETAQYGPARGGHHTLKLLQFLELYPAAGAADLPQAVRRVARASRRPGLAVLISDLYTPEGIRSILHELQGRGHEVRVLHLLSPDELDPVLSGELRLLDCESGAAVEASLDGTLRNLYRRRLQEWRSQLQTECRQRRAGYLPLNTAMGWETAVLIEMRKAGMLR